LRIHVRWTPKVGQTGLCSLSGLTCPGF
jgi:hypothetical protein